MMVLSVLTYIAAGVTALILVAVAFFARPLRGWSKEIPIEAGSFRDLMMNLLGFIISSSRLVAPHALTANSVATYNQARENIAALQRVQVQISLSATLLTWIAVVVLACCLVIILYHFFTGMGDAATVTWATGAVGGILGLGAGSKGSRDLAN